jgi:hypothetical protein
LIGSWIYAASSTRCKPSAGNRPRKQEAIMRAKPNGQRDLFEEQKASTRVPTTLKATLVNRIGALLVEAIGNTSVKARPYESTASGTGHEQDHS